MKGAPAISHAPAKRRSNAAMPFTGFSGFCGLTSHHTCARPRRFLASMLMCRCPSCAGLNEPPKRPMRTRRRSPNGGTVGAKAGGRLRPRLAVTAHLVFEGGELLDAHGPARVQAARGDADLRAHAE